MCGGAIISDFIPAGAAAAAVRARSCRLTAEYLWPVLKKGGSGNRLPKPARRDVIDLGDDFEADFREFKDDSDIDIDNDDDDDGLHVDVKPFAFAASKPSKSMSRGN